MADNHANFTSTTPNTPAVLTRATSPGSNGVHAITNSPNDSAVYGEHIDTGIGVFGRGGANGGEGLFGQTASGSSGVYGKNTAGGPGVVGESQSQNGYGVIGDGTIGVYGHSVSGGGYGVWGVNEGGTTGVLGSSSNIGVGGVVSGADNGGSGVAGFGGSTTSNTGVYGASGSGVGVYGSSLSGTGVYAESDGGAGLFATAKAPGLAASFLGNVVVTGDIEVKLGNINAYPGDIRAQTIFASALFVPFKLFKIDHPLDPANKYLYHSCIESPERKNIYDGIVILDDNGEAIVQLPDWFEAVNCDFRYQLTCIGGFAPVYIAEEITNNQFKISGGKAGIKLSWQVTGIRHDPLARANPMIIEEDKPTHERGYYQNPEAYGHPEEMGLHWVRDAEQRRRLEHTQPTKPAAPESPTIPTPPARPKLP